MRFIVFCLPFSVFSQAWSQDLETDRPDQTESSAVVPKGMFQIETGVGVEVETTNIALNSSLQTFTLPTTLFRIALGNRLEFRVVNSLLAVKETKGLAEEANHNLGVDALQLGFKRLILKGNGAVPQIALMSHVVLPTGTDFSPHYGSITKILVSHDLIKGCGIGYNLGFDYVSKNEQVFTYSVALNAPLTPKIGVYVEGFGNYSSAGIFVANADAGFTYLLTENMQLDYSFGVGINNRMNYQALGLSVRFAN